MSDSNSSSGSSSGSSPKTKTVRKSARAHHVSKLTLAQQRKRLNAFGLAPVARRTARKSRRATENNSPGPGNSAYEELQRKAFKKVATKAGIARITKEHKEIIQQALESASISGEVDKKALVRRLADLKGLKEGQATAKKTGKEAYEKAQATRKKRIEGIRDGIEAEKEAVEAELEKLGRKLGIRVPKKGMMHLAKLRAHGFELSAEKHYHLTKHLADRATATIKAELGAQKEDGDHDDCDACVLQEYLEMV